MYREGPCLQCYCCWPVAGLKEKEIYLIWFILKTEVMFSVLVMWGQKVHQWGSGVWGRGGLTAVLTQLLMLFREGSCISNSFIAFTVYFNCGLHLWDCWSSHFVCTWVYSHRVCLNDAASNFSILLCLLSSTGFCFGVFTVSAHSEHFNTHDVQLHVSQTPKCFWAADPVYSRWITDNFLQPEEKIVPVCAPDRFVCKVMESPFDTFTKSIRNH